MSARPPQVGGTQYVSGGKSATPRAVAIIAGIPVQIVSGHIDLNAHGATDSANITISNVDESGRDWTQQIATVAPGLGATAGALPQEKPVTVAIYAGFVTNPAIGSTDTAQLRKLFFGLTDMYHITSSDNGIEFECRSLASVLTQDKVTTAANNMSSVQFIAFMCKRWGIQTDIRLRSGQQAASLKTVYAQREIVGLKDLPAWDVMKLCAQVDDVQVWESLGTLHYVEPGSVKHQTLAVDYGRDLEDFKLSHSPWFNKNIQVEVRTYSRKESVSTWTRKTTNDDGSTTTTSGQRHVGRDTDFGTDGSTSSATSTSPTGAVSNTTGQSTSSGGLFKTGSTGTGYDEPTKQVYSFVLHNVTPQQAEAFRNAQWRRISMHEYSAEMTLIMTPQNLPYLDVTSFFAVSKHPNAKANDTYWPRTITLDMGIQQEPTGTSEGFTAKITAVNHRLADGAV